LPFATCHSPKISRARKNEGRNNQFPTFLFCFGFGSSPLSLAVCHLPLTKNFQGTKKGREEQPLSHIFVLVLDPPLSLSCPKFLGHEKMNRLFFFGAIQFSDDFMN